MGVAAPQDAGPRAVWLYYERMQEALSVTRRQWHASSVIGQRTLAAFEGLSRQEFEDALLRLRQELDEQVTLVLVAAFEALLRIDRHDRVSRRLKDPISRGLRDLSRDREGRVRLEDILDVHKQALGLAQVVGRLKQLLNYRHWLAHGRYWVQKAGIRADPFVTWEIGEALFSQVASIGSLEDGQAATGYIPDPGS